MDQSKKKIILICSGGGHLYETLQLEAMFKTYDYKLVTERTPFTGFFEKLYNISYLKARPDGKKRGLSFFLTLFINLYLSAKLLFEHYPKVIISTGSHTAVPMCFLARLLGIKIVFILSYARVNSGSKAADVIYPISDKFIVQWPDARENYQNAVFVGGLF